MNPAMRAALKMRTQFGLGGGPGIVSGIFLGRFGRTAQGSAIGMVAGGAIAGANDRSVLGGMAMGAGLGAAGGMSFAAGRGAYYGARLGYSRGLRGRSLMGAAFDVGRAGAKKEFAKSMMHGRAAARHIGNTSRKGYNTFRSMWR